MNMRTILLIVPTLMAIAACSGSAAPNHRPVDTSSTAPTTQTDPEADCGASRLQHLVGQPSTVLKDMQFAAPTRVIAAGMSVTMDFSPERLNFWLQANRRIERVVCG